MVKNLINFFIAVGLLLSQFLSLAVGVLQLLQSEPHTTNIGFIKLLIGELKRRKNMVLKNEIDAFVNENCK